MFLFLRLLLAHLIGDFPLQTGFVYSAKVKSALGKLLHVAIIAIIMILMAFPFWRSPHLWLIITVSSVLHYLQDWAKVHLLKDSPHPNHFLIFLIDQAFHVLILSTIWLTPLKTVQPICTTQCPFIKIYYDNHAIIFLICLLIASYVGTFFIATFKSTFLPKKFETDYLDYQEKLYGLLERSLMFLILYGSFKGVAFLLLFFFPKVLFAARQIKRLKGHSMRGFTLDTALGIIFVLIIYCFYRVLETFA